MIKYLQEKYALTKQGAKGLYKASWSYFFYYMTYVPPLILVMSFAERVLENRSLNPYIYAGGIVVAAVVMYLVTNYNYKTTYNETYEESANLRIEIADQLKALPLSYFSRHDVSDLAQTIMMDVSAIEHALSHAVGNAYGFVLYFLLMAIGLLVGNVKLGLAIIVPILLALLILFLTKRHQIAVREDHYHKLRQVSESFQSAIEMNQEIRSYGLKESVVKEIEAELDKSEALQWKSELTQVIPVSLSSYVSQLSLGITTLVGVMLYSQGEVSLIMLIGYIVAAARITDGVSAVYQFLAEMFYIDTKVNRIHEIRQAQKQEGELIPLDSFEIEFKDVTFSYDGEQKVIDGVSFVAEEGKVTSLIGPSGCGKTTILRLISRLYDYDSGQITIGGVDIKDLDIDHLFKHISIVFQDVVLFNTSVLENIRIGNKDATDEEVKRVARMTGCEDFIQHLEDGYDTLIGENGARLSGGERQRISIARAFLKDAPIVILDEVAASLDVENEIRIQENIKKLIQGKTVITISHRLKSVENTDKIIVMDQGRIDSMGQHQDLLQSSKLYQSMIEKSQLTEKHRY